MNFQTVFPSRGGWLLLTRLIGAVITLAFFQTSHAANSEVFAFQDYLNRDWNNEAVRVPLSAEQAKVLKEKPSLLGPDGKPVPYQFVAGLKNQRPSIEFLANVKADQKSVYRWGKAGGKTPATDLRIDEDATSIRLTNQYIGISLRKKAENGQGPIEKIHLLSGQWVGGSRLGSLPVPTAYTAKITQRGPVFCEVECRMVFGNTSTWQMTFRINAHEPVIAVSEAMTLGQAKGTFSLSLNENFNPDQLFYRAGLQNGKIGLNQNCTSDIKPGNTFVLEPWLHWWVRPEQAPVFSLYRSDSQDLLSVGAGFAGLWVDPKIPPALRANPRAELMKDEQGIHLDFEVKNGQRQWIIATLDKNVCLEILKDPALAFATPLPQQYLIKHGQFPLNLVKEYILSWDSTKQKYPGLLLNEEQVQKFRVANHRPPEVEQSEVDQAVGEMQRCLDTFLKQPDIPYGSAPHHIQHLGTAPLDIDMVLGSPLISPHLRQKLLAQAAFCSYAINRPDYWSPERGYSANPNMTTSVFGYRVALGSLIASHPLSRQWVNGALRSMKQQLYDWSDDNGGWLEAPHYAMVAYDAILGSALIAHNAGLNDLIFDPKMKQVINWFSKWSTPPDSRLGGFRHLAPLGNSYICEPSGEFGIVAGIWKEKDPDFASQMQWMFQQQKSWPRPGIGGSYPALGNYRNMMIDASIPAKAPLWESEWFPNTGFVLRNKFPADRETYLLLLAGSFNGTRSHYDDDSGSFTLWGKGRIIADDFGYYAGAVIDDHNLPSSPEIVQAGIFNVKTFFASKDFDYVGGARGPWQRQIAFMKDDDPLQPNYFVVSDAFNTAAPGTWRMWFTANNVAVAGENTATVVGKEDVDTDVIFATPGSLALKTEEKTRTSGSGIRPDGSEGLMATTQIGLIATAPQTGAMTCVLYPRLKTEKPPQVTSQEDGKVIVVRSGNITDYVFLSSTPFTWKQDDIFFAGTVGAIRLRDNKVRLSLGEPGSIGARGQTLNSSKAVP